MNEVKRQDGHLVEVVGIVKRASLDDKGVKVGRRHDRRRLARPAGTRADPEPRRQRRRHGRQEGRDWQGPSNQLPPPGAGSRRS